MGVASNVHSAAGKWEAELGRVMLPGCEHCGGSHPLARKGYQGSKDFCPDCDAPVGQPQDLGVEKARLGLNLMLCLARVLMWFGRLFNRLARGFGNGSN